MLKIETFSHASTSSWSQHDDGLFFGPKCIRVFVVDGSVVIIYLLIFQTLYFILPVITNTPYLVLVRKLPVFYTWQVTVSKSSPHIDYIYWYFGCFRQRVIRKCWGSVIKYARKVCFHSIRNTLITKCGNHPHWNLLINLSSVFHTEDHLCLTFQSLSVSLRTARFNIQKFYMVLALRWAFCADLIPDSDLCFIRY
jgi:hypothetical protein